MVTPGTSVVDGFDASASDSTAFDTAANALSESPPASPPYVLPSQDDFERAAAEALLNPNPAVEREIFESAFEDDSRKPAKRQRSSQSKKAPSGQEVTFANDKAESVTFVNDLGHPVTFDSAPPAPAPEAVALEARSLMTESGAFSVSGLPVDLTVKRVKGRRSARTTVGRSVLKNAAQIELTGASLVLQIDQRLESLRQERERLNSEESQAAVDAAISDWDDLRRRVEAFLETTSKFVAAQTTEATVNQKTLSLTEGVRAWWSKRHVQICDKVFDKALAVSDVGLFGTVLGLCFWVGAEPNLSVAIPGAWFGGKPVVEVIKVFAK